MLEYFEVPSMMKEGVWQYYPELLTCTIERYAEKHNLKIMQIAPYGTTGVYVLFSQNEVKEDEQRD